MKLASKMSTKRRKNIYLENRKVQLVLFTIEAAWQTPCKNYWKLFKICIVDGFYPSKRNILKNYSAFFSEIKTIAL